MKDIKDKEQEGSIKQKRWGATPALLSSPGGIRKLLCRLVKARLDGELDSQTMRDCTYAMTSMLSTFKTEVDGAITAPITTIVIGSGQVTDEEILAMNSNILPPPEECTDEDE